MSEPKKSEIIQLDDEKSQTLQKEAPPESSPTKDKPSLNPDEFPKIADMLRKRAEKMEPIEIPESPPLFAAIPLPMHEEKPAPEVNEANFISQVQQIKVVEDLQGVKVPDISEEYRKRCLQVLEKKKEQLRQVAVDKSRQTVQKRSIEEGEIIESYEGKNEAVPLQVTVEVAQKQDITEEKSNEQKDKRDQEIPQGKQAIVQAQQKNLQAPIQHNLKEPGQIDQNDKMVPEGRVESEHQSMDVEAPVSEIYSSQIESLVQYISKTLSAPAIQPPESVQKQCGADSQPSHLHEDKKKSENIMQEEKAPVPEQFEQVQPQTSKISQEGEKPQQQLPQNVQENIQPCAQVADKPEHHEQKDPVPQRNQQIEETLTIEDLEAIKKNILLLLPHEAEKLEKGGLQTVKQIYFEIKKDMNVDLRKNESNYESLPKQMVSENPAQKKSSANLHQQKVKPAPFIMDLDADDQQDNNAQEAEIKHIEQPPPHQQSKPKERRYSFGKDGQVGLEGDVEVQNNVEANKSKDNIVEKNCSESVSKNVEQKSIQNSEKKSNEFNQSQINQIRIRLLQRVPDCAQQINKLNDQGLRQLLEVLNQQNKNSEENKQFSEPPPKESIDKDILNECIKMRPEMAEELKQMSASKIRQIYEDCQKKFEKPLQPVTTNDQTAAIINVEQANTSVQQATVNFQHTTQSVQQEPQNVQPANTNAQPEAIDLDEESQKQRQKQVLAPQQKRVTIIEPEQPQKRTHENMIETNDSKSGPNNETTKKGYSMGYIRRKLKEALPQLVDQIDRLGDKQIRIIWQESVELPAQNKEKQKEAAAAQNKKDSVQNNGRPGILKNGEKFHVFESTDEKKQKRIRTAVMVMTEFDTSEHNTKQARSRGEKGSIVKKCYCDCCKKLDAPELLRRLADLVEEKK